MGQAPPNLWTATIVLRILTTSFESGAEDIDQPVLVMPKSDAEAPGLGAPDGEGSVHGRSGTASSSSGAPSSDDGTRLFVLRYVPPAERRDQELRLKVGGRVYVRDTLSGVDVAGETAWREERTIASGRAFVDARPDDRLRISLEVELADDDADLKDTFIRYRLTPALDIVAGRFKRPVSFLGLESSWSLPAIERGLLSELRVDERRLSFAGGRADGLSLDIEIPGALEPRLTIALVENDVADDGGMPISDATNQDLFGRAEVEPVSGLKLAVAGGWVGSLHRRGVLASYRHRPFATLEAALDVAWLRLWLEAMGGLNASSYAGDAQVGRFMAARGLIAPRLRRIGALRAFEPFAAASWYEPSTLQAGDHMGEVTTGLALSLSRNLRVQLEAGRRMSGGENASTSDRTIVRVQFGAAFKTERR